MNPETPSHSPSDEDGTANAPSPGPALALGLSIGVALATTLLFVAFAASLDLLASRALAVVLGIGSIGTLAALHVPAPHAPRLGFRGLDAPGLGATLLLVPVALLSSEIDNLARAWLGGAASFPEMPVERDVALWLQTLAVFVGIEALIEEWFFRGVLQQGSVERLGRLRGVVWCALLFALYSSLTRAAAPVEVVAVAAQSFVLGLALGGLRVATGSLLAPILLHATINAVAILGADWLPIAGFTAPGAHTDPLLLLIAAASCAAAFAMLRARESENRTGGPPPSQSTHSGELPPSEDD